MTLLEKLDYLMNENSINKRQLSLRSGLPYSTINSLYKMSYEKMQLTTFKALCDFFNVTMDSMAYDDREIEYRTPELADKLSREQKQLLKDYESITNPTAKRIIRDMASMEAKKEEASVSQTSGQNAG